MTSVLEKVFKNQTISLLSLQISNMQSKNELKRTFDQLKLSDRYLIVMSRYASERGTICLIEGKWGTFCQKWYLKG